MRVSIGPAIRVMLRGCAGWSSSAMIATAASTATQGWHTATICAPGPSTSRKCDDVVDEVVEVEAAVLQPDVARIVPVGDVDVVLGEHRAHGAAQQGGEMARHRRHQQHPRLRRQQCPFQSAAGCKRRAMNRDLAHRDRAGRRPSTWSMPKAGRRWLNPARAISSQRAATARCTALREVPGSGLRSAAAAMFAKLRSGATESA